VLRQLEKSSHPRIKVKAMAITTAESSRWQLARLVLCLVISAPARSMHSAKPFASHHGAPGIQVDPVHIHGVLSLVFWSMMIVVTFKYVLTIMKADNKGEGGSLALLALINRKSENAKWTAPFVLLGVFATALFYGDSMITPAMSVLSATEGLQYVNPGFKDWIVPIAVAILFGTVRDSGARHGAGGQAVRADHGASIS
jgi:hypothetical protein